MLRRTSRVPSQEEVRELFDYNEAGYLVWKKARGNRVRVGQRVGHKGRDGYLYVRFNDHLYKTARVIFLWHHGYYPENLVDHRDRDVFNERIENLRELSTQCNCRNAKKSRNNTSGVTGVTYNSKLKKWLAQLKVNWKNIYLGVYECFDDAVMARYKGELKYGFLECKPDSCSVIYLKERGILPREEDQNGRQ